MSESTHESIDSVLAKNLLAARTAAKLTQHELAEASRISRATIAQLETGYSDPRLSTIVQLARAVGVSPILLLAGPRETRAFADLHRWLTDNAIDLPENDIDRMRRLLRTGMARDRGRVAELGAEIATAAGHSSVPARIGAAVFSSHLPGDGTRLGIGLAKLLEFKPEE